MIVTKEIRKDHAHWSCKFKATTILELDCIAGYLNVPSPQPMAEKSCEFCRHRRCVGTVALNKDFDEIGRLARVDHEGTEWWEYYARPIRQELIK